MLIALSVKSSFSFFLSGSSGSFSPSGFSGGWCYTKKWTAKSEAKAYLVIIITNSIPSSIIKNNPSLITTKKDKEHHGLGLLTIRDVVEKYDGILNFSEENLCFSADVRLKLPNINQ